MATNTAQSTLHRGLRLMKIAGIQITIDASWVFIFILVALSLSVGYFPRQLPGQSTYAYWVAGLAATLLFFGSILIHELAHSLVAMRAGIHIPEIILFIFGGVSRLSEDAKDPHTEFKIAIVGPLTSFALALGFWGLRQLLVAPQPSLASAVLGYLIWINIAVGIFNLIPGFPLDGGRVLRAFLWHRYKSLSRATRVAADIGKGCAFILMLFGGWQIFTGNLIGGLWLIFIGMFLRGMAEGGYQEVAMRQALADVEVQDVMVEDVVSVPPDLSLQRLLPEYFLRYGYHGFPVVEDGKVLGTIAVEQVRQRTEDERSTTTVEHAMHPLSASTIIAPTAPLSEALKQMLGEGVGRLVVMQNGTMRGLITKTGLLRFVELKRLVAQ